MISSIKGILTLKMPTWVEIDVSGLGFGVTVPLSTFDRLPEIGQEVRIFTYLHVREDILALYGFYSAPEREMFSLLISVSGIGPKSAIAILSTLSEKQIYNAIITNDIKMLSSVQGIGKKTAEKLILELRDKIHKKKLYPITHEAEIQNQKQNEASMLSEDAILALITLGYSPQDSRRAINVILKDKTEESIKIESLIKEGPSARSVKLELSRFTLIGATTRSGLLTAPLRSRFGMIHHLNYYTDEDLKKIIIRSAKILNVSINEEAAFEIGKRSRGTARIANNLLKRVRDYALVKNFKIITAKVTEDALELLDVDHRGLDEMDKKILRLIIENYKGGPVGLNTLAVAVGEESDTLEEVYEPFLILAGFLKRTASGRCVTEAAWKHLGFKKQSNQQELF